MQDDVIRGREPALNMPGGLIAVILALVAIHAGRGFLSEMSDLRVLVEAGFIPARWSLAFGFADASEIVRQAGIAADDPDLAAAYAGLARYVVADGRAAIYSVATYAGLHGSWLHLGLNCVWLAAFATPVVRRCGTARSIVLGAASTVGAALLYWAANPLSPQVMIGASGMVSGFMGAAALFVFNAPTARFRSLPSYRRERAGFAGLLRNRSALMFLAVWFAINLATGLAAGPLGIAEGGIAWQAHIGGLLTGLLLFPWLDPVPHPQRSIGP